MIRNYENPEGTPAVIANIGSPTLVFTSTDSGATVSNGGVERRNAITTIAFCNTGAPNSSNESTNAVTVDIHIARKGVGAVAGNKIVSGLVVPAGETVFFSEERVVLENGDMIYVTVDQPYLAVTVSALEV